MFAGFVVIASALRSASPVLADEGQQIAAAEALFREGRSLLAEGKLREACEKFSESKRLDPAPGTMLNLARCYEDVGRTASAWATYRELGQRATSLGQTARAEFATKKAAELEPSLAMLVIRVPRAHRIDGLTVGFDGSSLGTAGWGSRVPVDPGTHRIAASAPGRRSWSQDVEAVASREATVEVPLLAEGTPPRAEGPAPRSSPMHSIGVVSTFGGTAVAVTGLVLRGISRMEDDAARDSCIRGCSPAGSTQSARADDLKTLSTVVTISGLSIAVVGLAIWLLAPPAKGRPTFAALAGKGTF